MEILVFFGVLFAIFLLVESASGGLGGKKSNEEAFVQAAKETVDAGKSFVWTIVILAIVFLALALK